MATPSWADDDWEACNDNGFVYKRRRRRRRAEDDSSDAPPPPATPRAADSECEDRRRLWQRRKKCLLGIRYKYRAELERWELLSSSLLSASALPPPPPPGAPPSSSYSPPQARDAAGEPLLDELLLQAEAQEAMLRKLSEVCRYVESVCDAEEERLAGALLDLPAWGSPRSLMTSLST